MKYVAYGILAGRPVRKVGDGESPLKVLAATRKVFTGAVVVNREDLPEPRPWEPGLHIGGKHAKPRFF